MASLPPPLTSLATVRLVPPSRRLRFPLQSNSEKWRERLHLSAPSNSATLAWEPAGAEKPWTVASKASFSSHAPLPPVHSWAAAPSEVLGPVLHEAPRSGKESTAGGAGTAHTTEASPDTEATLLSSAQGCRFCSAKSDELCRQSGSGGSGGRSGRGSASCCRCRSNRPARCLSASRSSAVWRLGERRRGVRETGPLPTRAAPPLGSTRPRHPAPHRHFVRRFWNHVLTCASVMRRALASAALSAEARYFWRRKRRSSSSTCEREKDVRGFFRFGGVRFW